jgi:hypothetical protein
MKAWRIFIALAILAVVLFAILNPALRRAKIGGGPGCIYYLKRIQLAKQMYAEDNKITNDVVFTTEQLLPYLGGTWPKCPAGGSYSIGKLYESPRCSFPAHTNLQVSVTLGQP